MVIIFHQFTRFYIIYKDTHFLLLKKFVYLNEALHTIKGIIPDI